ncbi:metalloprotease [Yersinia massiliensis]|uniref:M10 family metallopeptidase C-terminal domain-containing protein n=1 Tax=Yersinia massiliensis TaxID=419257 RepID=UPI0005DF7730|nr:M10 family metallopeptidase C-terminal domain-containing protein [Yersinia massiliensis]CNI53479.1 metalloprotease [Yersinia massiliensis]
MHFINENNEYSNSTVLKTHLSNKSEIKNKIATSIVHKYTWNGKNKYDNSIILKYSFNHPLIESMSYGFSENDISLFNQLQINQAEKSMQAWADVTNITYLKVSRHRDANIGFYNFSKNSNLAGVGYLPHHSKFGAIYINSFFSFNNRPTNLNLGGYVLTHEIGHTLGLLHTHDLKNTPNHQQHTQQVSIMSYRSAQASGAHYSGYIPSTPQLYDIAAIQYLYGANINTRIGDTVYGFNSNSEREFLSANVASDKLIFCVWDAGGIDTFDFSGYSENQTINLQELSFSDVGGLIGNISIAADVVIENAIGGTGDDKLHGNETDNILTGGAGADQLWGNRGNNIFRYNKTSESISTRPDTLHDFKSDKDKIDLSPILFGSNGIALVDRFSSSGQTEVIQKYNEIKDITYLMIDFDNNEHETDMMISLIGKHQLATNNFIVSPQLTA